MVKFTTGIVYLQDKTCRRTFGNLMIGVHAGPNLMGEFRPIVINLNFWYVGTFGRFFHAPSGSSPITQEICSK